MKIIQTKFAYKVSIQQILFSLTKQINTSYTVHDIKYKITT